MTKLSQLRSAVDVQKTLLNTVLNNYYGWAKVHGWQKHLDLDHTSDVARQLQICTAVIALATTLIKTLRSKNDAGLVQRESADLGRAISLPCFCSTADLLLLKRYVGGPGDCLSTGAAVKND